MDILQPQLSKDAELLRQMKQDDKKAFETLFKSHYASLVKFARNILKSNEQAEDIVQDVFIKIWDKRATLEETSSFKAYLFMAVRNQCFNTLKVNERKNWLNDEMENSETLSTNLIEANLNTKQLSDKISETIELLPEKCKLTFKLSRFENLSYKEIAETMNVSVKTVENQIGKALALLRKNVLPYLNTIILFYKIWC
ncbi:MAG: RNA polymerase sigma factor [Candidatus Methylacidiphilales bacterium]